MMSYLENPRTKLWIRKLGLPMIAGALCGFLAATAAFTFIESDAVGGLSDSRVAAVLVAVIYVVTAIAVVLGALNPRLGSKFLNFEDEEELNEMRSTLFESGLAMALWGIALAALAFANPEGPLASGMALAITAISLVAGFVFAVRSYRRSDELMSAVNLEAYAISYALAFAALGIWAIGAHLVFWAGPAPLDLMTTFYAVALAATFIAAGRRGMLHPR